MDGVRSARAHLSHRHRWPFSANASQTVVSRCHSEPILKLYGEKMPVDVWNVHNFVA
jgi:hypothetical protein